MEELTKLSLIRCPHCNAEYLPVELFIPNVFFGRPTHIEKDTNGKITDIVGTLPNFNEHYSCNYCKKPFKVTAKLQFCVKGEERFDFDNDYATKLKKESLFLNED